MAFLKEQLLFPFRLVNKFSAPKQRHNRTRLKHLQCSQAAGKAPSSSADAPASQQAALSLVTLSSPAAPCHCLHPSLVGRFLVFRRLWQEKVGPGRGLGSRSCQPGRSGALQHQAHPTEMGVTQDGDPNALAPSSLGRHHGWLLGCAWCQPVLVPPHCH